MPFSLELVAAAFGLVTTWFIARLVDPTLVPGGYFSFIVTGLVASTLLSSAVLVTARNVRDGQQRGTLEALLSLGASPLALALGMTAYPVFSGLYVMVAYTLLGGLLGIDLTDPTWSLAVTALMLGAFAFAGLGVIGAALVLTFRRATGAVGWLLIAMTFAAGEFPTSLLPGWIQASAYVSPFALCIRIVRAALLEGGTWSSSVGDLIALAGSAIVWWLFGFVALSLALRRARAKGSLGQY